MDKIKAISLLKSLPSDAGLDDPENWTEDAKQWCYDVVDAINFAVRILENSNVVGTLALNGKAYIVSE